MKINLIYILIFIPVFINANCKAGEINKSDWLIGFNSNELGKLQFALTFEAHQNEFTAYSGQNADVVLLGFWKARIARLFGSNLKKGSFVRISGKYETRNDSTWLKGIFYSPAGNYHFNGFIIDSNLFAALQNRDLDTIGNLNGAKQNIDYPLHNYKALVDTIFQYTENNIFDPELLQTRDWRKFKKHILKTGQKARDDIDLLFAFFYRSKKLPFSHYFIYQPAELTLKSNDNKEPFEFNSLNDSIAYLKIHSFTFTPDSMHALFSNTITEHFPYLIIDLRGNAGGNLTGMALIENLTDTTFYGGIFLNNKWYKQNNRPADVSEYEQFPVFSDYDLDSFFNLLHTGKGLLLMSKPVKNPYSGKIYVITDRFTASTSEPIVYHLKYYNLATIVGKNTAGAMLSAESYTIFPNWKLYIPTADYYTNDGVRLEKRGVAPHFEIDDEDPLELIIERMKWEE